MPLFLRCALLGLVVVASGAQAQAQAQAATVATGEAQSCAIFSGGALKCWGADSTGGALGTGTNLSPSDTADPQAVAGMGSGVTAVQVTSTGGGSNTTGCAIKSSGAFCWGVNSSGQGGNGTTTHELSPRPVSGLGSGVTEISVNTSRACAVHNGAAKCWGSGLHGDGTSNDSTVPVIPKYRPQGDHAHPPAAGDTVTPLDSGVTSIAAGWRHICAIWTGQVVCSGDNTGGQLGYSGPAPPGDFSYSTPYRYYMRPLSEPLTNPVKVVAGSDMNCALLANGSVWCWGSNDAGRLGRSSTTDPSSDDDPAQVVGLGSGVTDVAANSRHVCAVKDGQVLCWGDGQSGKLGNGPVSPHGNDAGAPVLVSNISGASSVAVGGDNSCAMVNGEPMCWGSNNHFQLGTDQVRSFSGVPVRVTGSTPKPPPEVKPTPTPRPTPAPAPVVRRPVVPAAVNAIIAARSSARLSRSRIATLATVGCPAGATCRTSAPRTIKVSIRRKRYTLSVLGTGAIRAGRRATIRVRLPAAAVRRLGRRSVSVGLRLTTTVNGVARAHTLRVRIVGR